MPLPFPGRAVEALRRSTAFVSNTRGRNAGSGSAIVLSDETLITNAHVVGAGQLVVESWEGRTAAATILRIDHSRDLALLRAPALGAPAAVLADSDAVRPGTPVVAVGNPAGFKGAVSTGTIHSAGPIFINGAGPAFSRRWICADVRLAPGNSGGPLADWEGRVIGVNTMVLQGGLALAVPSRAVNAFLSNNKLRTLGVTLRPVQLGQGSASQGGIGLLILEIDPQGVAAAASLLPGDVLTGVTGHAFRSLDDLETALAQVRDGTLTLQFRRGGKEKGRRVTVRWAAGPVKTAA